MTALDRDVLQELFDSRFPRGARVLHMGEVPPFATYEFSTPRVAVLGDGYLMFDLPTNLQHFAVKEVTETEDYVEVITAYDGLVYRFSEPNLVANPDLIFYRDEVWTDERLERERAAYEEWE